MRFEPTVLEDDPVIVPIPSLGYLDVKLCQNEEFWVGKKNCKNLINCWEPGDNIIKVVWDWGDGNQSIDNNPITYKRYINETHTESSLSHTYETSGKFIIEVQFINDKGDVWASESYKIRVKDTGASCSSKWITINDPGVPGHEGFNGQMSKYETTNEEYCQYLNSALADGLIKVYNNVVYAASDTSNFFTYFETYAANPYSQITWDGSTFSVRSRDGYSMANHPVTQVSWLGATEYCNYYGYRLPTEWEWQAVADYDGTYIYACGTTLDHTKANYKNVNWNPLGLSSWPYTTPVGYYPAYGYGLHDMTGNADEWTSSLGGGGY